MEKRHAPTKFAIAVEVFFDTLSMIALHYILTGCRFAFRADLIYVFFFALDIYYMHKFWDDLSKNILNKLLRMVILVVVFVTPLLFAYFVGRLDVSLILGR